MIGSRANAYIKARLGPRNRSQVLAGQDVLLRRLRRSFRLSPALAAYADTPFADLPIIDTARFRADFEGFNTVRLAYPQAFDAAGKTEDGHDGDLPHGLTAGFSTGTGGQARGLFITSPDERAVYAGYLAGKLLSPFELATVTRIGVCLRAPSRLYERRGMRFFGLQDAGRDAAIAAFDPQVLVAPSQVLLDLAGNAQRLASLRHLYYGAETLNAAERDFITRRLGCRPDPVYQATEGFIGAPCRHGTLHLNEDSFIVEPEDLGQGRFRPVITDLQRRSQLVVRLRLDDVLQATTCACGSPLMAVRPIEGRVSDVWRWDGQTVFPGDVEAIVQNHVPGHSRWIATGHTGGISYACENDADANGLETALRGFGRPLARTAYHRDMDMPKRRHVRWLP